MTKRPPCVPLTWSRARYFHGVTYGRRFHTYVIDTRGPALQTGDTVILDNLLLHKAAGVRDTIEYMGGFLLPTRQPRFKFLQQALAMFKAELCGAAARIMPDLEVEIGKALGSFKPPKRRNVGPAASTLALAHYAAARRVASAEPAICWVDLPTMERPCHRRCGN